MKKTDIEYLTHTWNPIAMRCTKISPACDNCWHLRMADRLAENPVIPMVKREAYAGGKVYLDEKELEAPLKIKKPAIIGVQFMGDLFHEQNLWPILDKILFIMQRTPQHIYLILTKRIGVAVTYFESNIYKIPQRLRSALLEGNIWLGVTVENQEQVYMRIPLLLQIPAAHYFVSIEPVLSEIDLTSIYIPNNKPINALNIKVCVQHAPGYCLGGCEYRYKNIDLVICGCESGPKRRPTDIKAIRSLRDQCVESNTPFFLKQMDINGKVVSMPELDGKVWDQLPWDNI